MSDKDLLTPETFIVRNESKFLSSIIGDEIVMMNLETGEYIGINTVGGDIWNLLTEPMSIASVINKIVETYDVTGEQAQEKIIFFLHNAIKQGLIKTKAD